MPDTDIFPGIASKHEIRTKTGDGLDMVISSGYATLGMKGASDGTWNRQDLILRVGPQWAAPHATVPVVSLASVMNLGTAHNAGWAVDTVAVTYYDVQPGPPGVQVELRCGLAVRDPDGILYRVTYQVTTIGRLDHV